MVQWVNPYLSDHFTATTTRIITVTSKWARWRLQSPTSRFISQPYFQAQIKENIKPSRHWPLYGDSTGHWWIPLTKDQKREKCFHLMTSSWSRDTNHTNSITFTKTKQTITNPRVYYGDYYVIVELSFEQIISGDLVHEVLPWLYFKSQLTSSGVFGLSFLKLADVVKSPFTETISSRGRLFHTKRGVDGSIRSWCVQSFHPD